LWAVEWVVRNGSSKVRSEDRHCYT
jgi:hypothetical protein